MVDRYLVGTTLQSAPRTNVQRRTFLVKPASSYAARGASQAILVYVLMQVLKSTFQHERNVLRHAQHGRHPLDWMKLNVGIIAVLWSRYQNSDRELLVPSSNHDREYMTQGLTGGSCRMSY